jgi:hypothetical protein
LGQSFIERKKSVDIASALFYGVVSSVIASILFEILRSKSGWFPGPLDLSSDAELEPPILENSNSGDVRAANRRKLRFFLFNLFFYSYTFFVIYAAILLPPMLKGAFSNVPVFLSDARFIGLYLPQVAIGSNLVQGWVITLAVVIYLPLLFVVNALAGFIAEIVNKFRAVTIYRWRSIQGLLFIAFAAILAIFSIYLFNDGSLKDAVLTLFGFIVLAFIFAQANRR